MATEVYFEYKKSTDSTWTETTKQTITTTQDYDLDVSTLDMGTIYECRAVVNDDGCVNSGATMTFFTWSEEVNNFDSLRKLLLDDIFNGDTLRQLLLDDITNFDTLRKIAYGGYFSGKTYRSIVKYYEELFDSLRELVIDDNINFDLLRVLILSETVDFDSLRQLIVEDSSDFDTLRQLVVEDSQLFDTLRKLIDDSGFSTGLLRILRSATVEEDEDEGMENCYVFFKDAELAILGNSLDVSGFSDFNLELSSKFGSSFESIIEGKIDQNWYEIQSIKKDDLSLIGKPSIVGFYLIDLTGLKFIRCSLNSALFDEITARGHLSKERDF